MTTETYYSSRDVVATYPQRSHFGPCAPPTEGNNITHNYLQANRSTYEVKLAPNEMVKVDLVLKKEPFWTYCIIEGDCMNSEKIYVAKCLIDEDYPGFYYAFVKNLTAENVVTTVNFKLTFTKIVPGASRPIYNNLMFNYFASSKYDVTIKRFHKATTNASSYDLVFDKDLTIYGRGILNIRIPLSEEYRNRPNTFLMRSKFGRQGVMVYEQTAADDKESVILMLTNYSDDIIDLGKRFMCVIPDANTFMNKLNLGQRYVKTEITTERSEGCEWERSSDYYEAIPINVNEKERALK